MTTSTTTASTITVQQFLEARTKLENDLNAAVSKLLLDFQQRTGLHPSYIDLNIKPLESIGESKTHIFAGAKAYFEI